MVNAVDDPVEIWTPPGRRSAADPAVALRSRLRRLQDEAERLARALAAAEARAERDPLTGLLNRRGFERELSRTLANCRRYGGEAALIYIDLDRFKVVNDTLGHAAGDALLVQVAGVLSRAVRESDAVARLGGDEFAVVLNHAGRAIANAKARSLAAMVSEDCRAGAAPVSFTWGVRTFEPGMSVAQMVAEADAAMFIRKTAGRREYR